ncbi:MAG: triphosphoribosyl-dephospho-CoA synthase [Fretibacterium sp.]|nr:triphosphoribosyl-dephospho-CoA synthase [Fretibacterium sp.]
MNNIFIFNIARLAVSSVLNAIAIHPRPGLVTPLEKDALDGTEFPVFLDGAMGMFPCLVNCASVGSETEEMNPEDVMTLLRPVGQQGERDILQATRGRLGFRGTLFLTGLLAAAAGRLIAQRRNLTPMALGLTGASFVQGISERELWPLENNSGDEDRTAGERAYILYGIDGCRGEAERRFPLTLRTAGLLQNLEGTHGHLSLRERAAHVLIHIMVWNADTSLAARGGIDELLRVQEAARNTLAAGGMLTPSGREAVNAMDREFRRQGISPRGSTVILSAAFFILALGEMCLTRSGQEE